MKNYYEILEIRTTATEKQILKAYRDFCMLFSKGKITEEELNEARVAYETLIDAEKRAEYDKNLADYLAGQVAIVQPVVQEDAEHVENKEGVQQVEDSEKTDETSNNQPENVNNPWFRRAVSLGLAIALFGGGYVVGKALSGNDKETTQTSIEGAIVDEPNNDDKIDEIKKLTAENFEQTVNTIVKDNEAKGLVIDPVMVRSTLFITNIDYLSQEDIKTLYGDKDLNMMEEIINMYNYTSAVATHNGEIRKSQIEDPRREEITGKKTEKTTKQYVSFVEFAYDEEDKLMLEELDTEYLDLVTDLKNKTMTNEEYQASIKYTSEFFTGVGSLDTKGKSYSNYSFTSGGGLLSEFYWLMMNEVYTRASEFLTDENYTDIVTITKNVTNGSRYLSSIINHESLNCLEETEKTLVKNA